MDKNKIEDLFFKVIEKRGISEILQGYSKDVIYKWRKNKSNISFGDMLDVLSQLDMIEIKIK